MNEARRTLAARREHSKGDGNFPDVEPTSTIVERPEDRAPGDLPNERDPRSAPKGNVTTGQLDRNPELDMRDEHRAPRPVPNSGFEEALGEAIDATSKASKTPARPNARRSASAKRDAVTTRPKRARVEGAVPKTARGSVTARKAKKASRAKSRRTAP